MRLKGFINESQIKELNENDTNTLIHKNCKQYLKLIKNMPTPFYRGIDNVHVIPFGIKKVRKDRVPNGMSVEEAIWLNNWLSKNGHSRRDESMMVTSDVDQVDLFGSPYYVFPLDPIKGFTFIRSLDVNLPDRKTGWDEMATMKAMEIDRNGGDIDKEYRSLDIEKPFSEYFVSNKRIEEAHKNGYELWFDCDSYYVVREWAIWNKRKQTISY